ncbi:MAG: biotin/lipoyl-containing protein [Pseudomonadota bacterium]
MIDIPLKPLDANADFVVLVEWVIPDGSAVVSGETICHVETSKTVTEIVAPSNGVLIHRVKVGEKVEVGAVLASISELSETPSLGSGSASPNPMAVNARVSRRAQDLMGKYHLDIADFPAEGFISASDVEKRFAQHEIERHLSGGGIFPLLDGINLSGLTFPEGSSELSDGRLTPEFLLRLRADPDAFRALSENERLDLLRQHGASIGDGVRLGAGVFICAPQIVLAAGASIEAGGEVWCAERFIMGPLARFGPRLSLRCQQAVIGAAVWAENDITIGGGGHRDPWAVITIGDNSYIGGEVFLNTCRPVLIGQNVFVTNRATLLTHNIGHSYLHGHENRFSAVVLEDASQVGINTVVYAGARVGRGAVIGSNGYVVDSIPAGKLAFGVPARVVGEAQQTLSPQRQAARAREIFDDLFRLLSAKGYETARLVLEGNQAFTVKNAESEFGLVLQTDPLAGTLGENISWVVWTLAPSLEVPQEGVVIMDLLTPLISGAGNPVWVGTLCEYLRKRGLKIQPTPWRYQGGLI